MRYTLNPNYLPALFEVLMQSFEIIMRQGLLHGDLAKRAKHFFTESARVCAGTQNSVCLFCLHIAPYIKSSQLFRKQESDVNGMEAGWHRY